MMKVLQDTLPEKKNEFFSDQKSDFTISKENLPENTLVYVNQGTISTIKSNLEIYTDCFISGQIVPVQNSPKDIFTYKCKQNEFKMIVLLYNLHTGDFLGLEMRLAYIVL